MSIVRKVRPGDFDEVYSNLLSTLLNKHLTKQMWMPLFRDNWGFGNDQLGYVLEDNGKIVGYAGTIVSRREINGKLENFCNGTSWAVLPEYRSESLNLIFPLLELKDYTILNLTPNEVAYKLYSKLNFKHLESTLLVFPQIPNPFKLLSGCRVVTDTARLERELNKDDLKVYQDFKIFKKTRFIGLQTRKNGPLSCIMLKKIWIRGLPFASIQYIGDLGHFLSCIDAVKLWCAWNLCTVALLMEKRFAKGKKLPFCLHWKMKRPSLYRSNSLAPEDIDLLYTEHQVIDS